MTMMLSSSWIMMTTVVLLTTNFVSYSLSSSQHEKNLDYEGDSMCSIQDSYNSPYVQAFHVESISSPACNSSGSSSKILPVKSSPWKEVHVLYIHFASNKTYSAGTTSRLPRVVLNIFTDNEDALRHTDVVFVLASNQSVTWKISSDFIPKIRQLSIWVSMNSQLLPVSGSNVKVRKFETISNAQQLHHWVTEKFNRITTMKELNFQRKITRSVGLGSSGGKMCREQNLKKNSETKGCIMPANQGLNNKDVHIIELEAGDEKSSTVTLSIRSRSFVPVRRHLLLVLKSHRPAQWVVLTSKLRGTLDIITDQVVDTNGIEVQSVRVVNERLSNLSESKLIAWTVANYGSPVSYTSASVANRIDLMVDGLDENWRRRQDFGTDNADEIVQTLLENIRTIVGQHRSVSCLPGSMEVALLKRTLMAFALSNTQLSLDNPKCIAEQNNTHFFWKTNPESCGSVLRHHGDSMAVENAILVQPVKPSVSDPVVGFSGSGMEDDDESDDGYDDSLSDDEDVLRSLTVRVNFVCSYFLGADIPVECKSDAQHCSSSSISLRTSTLQSGVTTKAMTAGPLILRSAANRAVSDPSSQVTSSSSPGHEIQQVMTHDDDAICSRVIRVEGLDSPSVIAIAFAAFFIGAVLSGTLWYIHSRTGPGKKRALRSRSAETSGDSTPCSTAPITVCQTIDQV